MMFGLVNLLGARYVKIAICAACMVALASVLVFGYVKITAQERTIEKQKVALALSEFKNKELEFNLELVRAHNQRVQVIEREGQRITKVIEKIKVVRDLSDEERDIAASISSRLGVQSSDDSKQYPANLPTTKQAGDR